jgi:hypothetical protein
MGAMATTQRTTQPPLPPEVLAQRQIERQLERTEARWDVETPGWGGATRSAASGSDPSVCTHVARISLRRTGMMRSGSG